MSLKQVIVWRHDLNCRAGKKMGQAAHASRGHLDARILAATPDENGNITINVSAQELEWMQNGAAKIVVRVESEDQLMQIFEAAEEANLPVHLVTDLARTEWNDPTRTCLAIGPAESEKIDEITGVNGIFGRLNLM